MRRNKLFHLWIAGAAALATLQAQPASVSRYQIRTLIGQSQRGDGGLPTAAILDTPQGLAEDPDGNIYIAESGAGRIRRIRAADGMIELFAGAGPSSDSAPGLPATQTNIGTPTLLLTSVDGKGILYADSANCRIRRIAFDGSTITDVAGSGRCAGSGGGRPSSGRDRLALDTDLGVIGGMTYDLDGRLLFTETNAHLVRRLDTDGYIRIIAGTGAAGSTGDGAEATSGALNYPRGIAVDSAGAIYIGDGYNCKVRRITTDGNIETAFGAANCAASTATFVGGPRSALDRIGSLAYDPVSNYMYISLPRASRVLRFDFAANRMSPYLGNGRVGVNDTDIPLALNLNEPAELLVQKDGSLLASADDSFRVYRVKDGKVSAAAGSWPQAAQYPSADQVGLIRPQGLLLTQGSVVAVDAGAGRIVSYAQDTGAVQPVAGLAFPSGYERGLTGPALEATLLSPDRLILGPDGDLYFSEATRIRAISAQDGTVRTILDGLDKPVGLAFDTQGRLWYAESNQHRIMRLDAGTKTPVQVAGSTTGLSGFSGDGAAATSALLNSPGDIVFDPSGNLLIADRGNNRIRKLSPDGVIRTIAGSGLTFIYADMTGLSALDAGFGPIDGLAVDAAGRIYVSERLRIDVINSDGKVQVLTGFLAEDDNGARTYIDGPLGGSNSIAVDADGRLYISLKDEGRIVVATPLALVPPPPAESDGSNDSHSR
jgi:sugar lactone lactonase YvrE